MRRIWNASIFYNPLASLQEGKYLFHFLPKTEKKNFKQKTFLTSFAQNGKKLKNTEKN